MLPSDMRAGLRVRVDCEGHRLHGRTGMVVQMGPNVDSDGDVLAQVQFDCLAGGSLQWAWAQPATLELVSAAIH